MRTEIIIMQAQLEELKEQFKKELLLYKKSQEERAMGNENKARYYRNLSTMIHNDYVNPLLIILEKNFSTEELNNAAREVKASIKY